MKLSFRKAILIYTLVPIIILFSLFAINNILMIKREALQSIENHMTDLAISYAGIFDGFLKPIEGAAKINASLIEESDHLNEKKIYKLLELQVENNPIIYGAAVAFMPDQYSSDRHLFAPYVYQNKGEIKHMDIAESAYDYTKGWEWWERAKTTGKASWTEPYFDEGAGNKLMSTYVVPFFKKGELWGVTTADIALHDINDKISIPGIEGQELMVISATGKIILYPDLDKTGESIYKVIEDQFKAAMAISGTDHEEEYTETKSNLISLVKQMLSGEAGLANLKYMGIQGGYWSFFAPIQSVGWSFSIRVKESQIYKAVYEQFWLSILFFCLLILLIIIAVVLVSGKFSRSLDGLMRRCERIERLNFQPAGDQSENIDEIKQLSHTLNNMCLVLDSHYSIKEDARIAEAIRQHALPNDAVDIEMRGYQLKYWSNAEGDSCGEVFDFVTYSPCTDIQNRPQDRDDCLAILLLDDADSGIDAAIKNGQLRAIFRVLIKQGKSLTFIAEQMNDYLMSDMTLNGAVQLSLGVLDTSNATLNCLNLGQNGVFYYSSLQASQYKGYQQALGTQKNLSGIHVKNIAMQTDDIVVLCSDGVLGALNKQREQFGRYSIERIIQQSSGQSANALIENLQTELESFTTDAYMQTERSIVVLKRC